MKKELKELIENAEFKTCGEFDKFICLSNGEYDGFWGKNGYDNILLLGHDIKTDTWYKIANGIDIFNIYCIKCVNIHIPHKYGVPEIWFEEPIKIKYDDISSCTGNYDKYYKS